VLWVDHRVKCLPLLPPHLTAQHVYPVCRPHQAKPSAVAGMQRTVLPHALTPPLAGVQDRMVRMQQALARVWHRFAYTSHPALANDFRDALEGQEFSDRGRALLEEQDAFATIMQWLYGRIDAVTAAKQQVAKRGAAEAIAAAAQ
jgi:hypothetical protein